MMARRYEAGTRGMMVAAAMAMSLGLLLLVISPRRETSELLAAKKAAGSLSYPGLGKKSSSQLFGYLSQQSYTPAEEKTLLADRLGAQINKAGMKPHAHQPASLNVPYFSKFVHPEPHYSEGGMHSAAMHWKSAHGVEDSHESKKLIQAQQAQALSKELRSTMHEYLKDENHGITWTLHDSRPQYAAMQAKLRQHALSPSKAEALAKELAQTQENYFTPGASAPKTQEKFVSKQAGEALAKSLEAGEEAALRPRNLHTLHQQGAKVNMAAGKELAAELNAGEADALAIEAKRAINQEIEVERRKNLKHVQTFSKDLGPSLSKKQSEALLKDLEPPMNVVSHKIMHPTTQKMIHSTQVNAKAAVAFKVDNHNLQQLRSTPSVHTTLNKQQDKRVAEYLQAGLRDALPLDVAVKEGLRQPVHHVKPTLDKQDGEKLIHEAHKIENMEYKNWVPKHAAPKFLKKKSAADLAKELGQSLKIEQSSEGAYVKNFIHKVTGKEVHSLKKRIVSSRGTAEWYNRALAKRLSEGIEYYKSVEQKKQREAHEKLLNPKQTKALGQFLSPPLAVGKDEAPGLGYAV